MRIERRQDVHVVVLDCIGRLVGPNAGALMEKTLRTLGRSGAWTVVVNLVQVPAIDLAGLAGLLTGQRDVRAAGGEVRLAGFNRQIGDPATVTTLATVFNVFESVEQALDGSIPARPAPEAGADPSTIPMIQRLFRRRVTRAPCAAEADSTVGKADVSRGTRRRRPSGPRTCESRADQQ